MKNIENLTNMAVVDPPTENATVEAGEAKFVKDVETVDVKPTTKLIGLTKEQLELYRNDPFWRPFRYALVSLVFCFAIIFITTFSLTVRLVLAGVGGK